MKTSEFEKAINSLPIDITIDEIVLSHGQVKEVYAHSVQAYLKWKGDGMCFEFAAYKDLPNNVIDTKNIVPPIVWIRNHELDIEGIWHSPEEKPKDFREILVEKYNEEYDDNFWAINYGTGEVIFSNKDMKVIRWAYLKDVLEKIGG